MTYNLFQVDAFTDKAFRGNPAAVCLLEAPAEDAWMQSLAAEMNLSETAFLLPEGKAWRLRWFTPTTEVDLCGHATLASAKVLFETQPELKENPLVFNTLSGKLLARWVAGAVELDFPAMVYRAFDPEPVVSEVLGFEPVAAVFSDNYFLFEAEAEDLIRHAQPDIARLARLPMPEVIITAKSADPAFDFISRFFAPQLGVDEDPVTGSAHCLLTPYWAKKFGKQALRAYQASARGGVLDLRLVDARVRIKGDARIVFRAELLI